MAKRKKRKANEVNKNKIIREFYENGAIVSDCNYGKKAVCNKWDLSEVEFDELVMPKDEAQLLIASHIKPWNVSDEKTERTNPQNGLCLNALHDKAFDKGLITINNKYEIIISKQMKNIEMDQATKDWFMKYDHKEIIKPDKFFPDPQFIEYHNDVIFQK